MEEEGEMEAGRKGDQREGVRKGESVRGRKEKGKEGEGKKEERRRGKMVRWGEERRTI
jgi:hypothetical protein